MAQFSTKTSQQKEIFVYDRRLSQPLTIYNINPITKQRIDILETRKTMSDQSMAEEPDMSAIRKKKISTDLTRSHIIFRASKMFNQDPNLEFMQKNEKNKSNPQEIDLNPQKVAANGYVNILKEEEEVSVHR